jgi:hypothetical protein
MYLNGLLASMDKKFPFLIVSQFNHMTIMMSIVQDIYLTKKSEGKKEGKCANESCKKKPRERKCKMFLSLSQKLVQKKRSWYIGGERPIKRR